MTLPPSPAAQPAFAPAFADLHVLTVLSQTRSYTQAAQRLGVSKATVSQRIAALERAIGVPLVQRSTRAVALTAAGQQLADETDTSFQQIAQSVAAVRDLASTPRGLVRVSAPVALGRQHVMPRLARFLAQHPEVRVELDLNDRLVNLVQDGFDLAIRHAHAAPDNCVAWTLCASHSVLVASPAYLQRRGTPSHPDELAAHDCLVYLRGRIATQTWTLVRHTRRGEGPPCSVPVQGPIKANNSEVLRDAALAGLGIALLPDFSATSTEAASDALVRVLPNWRVQGFFGGSILAIRPWAPKVPKAVAALVRHLQAEFKPGFS